MVRGGGSVLFPKVGTPLLDTPTPPKRALPYPLAHESYGKWRARNPRMRFPPLSPTSPRTFPLYSQHGKGAKIFGLKTAAMHKSGYPPPPYPRCIPYPPASLICPASNSPPPPLPSPPPTPSFLFTFLPPHPSTPPPPRTCQHASLHKKHGRWKVRTHRVRTLPPFPTPPHPRLPNMSRP